MISRIHSLLSACLFLFALSSCVGKPPDSAHLSRIKRVGVISAIGSELRLQETATVVFGNTLKTGNVSEWKIDEFVTEEISQQLNGRYEVHKVTYLASDFGAGAKNIDVQTAIREQVKTDDGAPLDAYLVVLPVTQGDKVFATNQQLFGIALYRRSFMGMHQDAVYVSARIVVFDGHDFREIGRAGLAAEESLGDQLGRASFLQPGRIFRPVSPELWSESFDGFTKEQKDRLRSEFVALLHDQIPHTVKALKLVE